MRKIVISLIYLLSIQQIFAQSKHPENGYIITNANDTIIGNITLVENMGYFMMIEFRTLDMKKQVYKADKLKGFYYENHCFETLEWQESHYFFEKILHDQVSLYSTFNSIYFGQNEGGLASREMQSEEYFILDSSGITSIKQISFNKTMINYTKDCPTLADKINRKELKFDNLKQIVEEYNLCIKEK
jgi:hypothetical protein